MATKKPDEVKAAEEYTPTPAEARLMFADNPGLAMIVTTEGELKRGE